MRGARDNKATSDFNSLASGEPLNHCAIPAQPELTKGQFEIFVQLWRLVSANKMGHIDNRGVENIGKTRRRDQVPRTSSIRPGQHCFGLSLPTNGSN